MFQKANFTYKNYFKTTFLQLIKINEKINKQRQAYSVYIFKKKKHLSVFGI